jgi:thioredoxin-like negative regulator of GroEL
MPADFTAYVTPWCVHCSRLVADFAGDSSIQFVDVNSSPAEAEAREITGHPAIVAILGGQEIARTIGYGDKESLRAWMQRVS